LQIKKNKNKENSLNSNIKHYKFQHRIEPSSDIYLSSSEDSSIRVNPYQRALYNRHTMSVLHNCVPLNCIHFNWFLHMDLYGRTCLNNLYMAFDFFPRDMKHIWLSNRMRMSSSTSRFTRAIIRNIRAFSITNFVAILVINKCLKRAQSGSWNL